MTEFGHQVRSARIFVSESSLKWHFLFFYAFWAAALEGRCPVEQGEKFRTSVRTYVCTFPPPKSQIERSLGLRLGSLGLNWGSLDLIRGPLP